MSRFHLRCASVVLINVLTSLCIDAAIYNNHLAIKVQSQGTPNSFFGYSVAMQNGNPPRVVVGAPKDGVNRVGSVYVCPVVESDSVASDKSCKRYTIDQTQHIAINSLLFGCTPLIQPFNILIEEMPRVPGNCKIDYTVTENTQNILRKDSMFGAAIDGGISTSDDLLIGAARLTEIGAELDFCTGGVFRLSDLENNKLAKYPVQTGQHTYNATFQFGMAQFGFSLHAVNKSTEFLFGTPGYGHWHGDAWRTYYTDGSSLPGAARRAPFQRVRRAMEEHIQQLIQTQSDVSSLGGYADSSGRFFGHTSYVVGLPNDRNMQGAVKFFQIDARTNQMQEEHIMWPPIDRLEMAEHFGSALLAADVNGDGHDDLLVGAPNGNDQMGYDNGKVYVFLSNGVQDFKLHQTLIGEPKSRLGTSLANLGRITLDQYEAIAVGSPYEDDIGAVRVYVWVDGMLTLDSKVSLAEFPSFGYSLSRAVDVDSNNFADFAVGAYKSNAIAVLKSKTVFSYDVTIEHNTLYADRDDKSLQVTICTSSSTTSTTPIYTEITYEFDARINQNTHKENAQISSNVGKHCKTFSMELRPKVLRTSALSVVVKLQEKTCDYCPVRSPTHPSTFERKIPFKLNCKNDPCLPFLTIDTNIESSIGTPGQLKLLVGEENKPELIVKVTNQGDPALACTIDVSADHVALPIRGHRCADKCDVGYIIAEATQKYTLDFTEWSTFQSTIDLEIVIECFNSPVKSFASLKLEYQSELTVDRIELTQQYDSQNASTYDVTGAAIFHIRNDGPSRLEEAIYFVQIPRTSHDEHIQDIYMPEKENNDCKPVNGAYDTKVAYVPTGNSSEPEAAGFGSSTSLENTISCNHPNVQCLTIRCRVRSLTKGTMHVINFPTRPYIAGILKNYKTTFSIISTMYREGEKEVRHESELDVVDKQTVYEGVAIWIIIVAILGALVVLALIIFTLYKLGFFVRHQHELMKEEMEAEAELEGVELRRHEATDDETPDEPEKTTQIEKEEFQPPQMLC